MSIVAGIDPGKHGYACSLDAETKASRFWAAPMDEDGDYDVVGLATITRGWAADGVALVVIERQAPQRHGSGKFGAGKEGTQSSWTNGFGYGLWIGVLAAAGFSGVRLLEVEPLLWKSSMGCLAGGFSGEDTHHARRKAAAAKTIEVCRRVDPGLDLLPVERTGRGRVPSPDKAVARLLAEYGAFLMKVRGEDKKE